MDDTTRNDRQMVFSYLMNCGLLLKVSVGAIVGGVFRNDYIVIHEAPPRVLREVINNFHMISLRSDGLLVPLTPLTHELSES